MLFGILSKFLDEKEIIKLKLFDEKESRLYLQVLDEGFNVPITTSAGRILDATSALLGLCDERTYDGRPAMLLESVATKPLVFDPVISDVGGKKVLQTTTLFEFLLNNIKKDKTSLAATAQMYLTSGLFEIARAFDKPVVVSGGVAYNDMISSFLINQGVFVHKNIPCGDGGLCFGQAYLANIF